MKKEAYSISNSYLRDAELMNRQRENFKENITRLIGADSDNQILADLIIDLYQQNEELLGRLAKVEYYTTK